MTTVFPERATANNPEGYLIVQRNLDFLKDVVDKNAASIGPGTPGEEWFTGAGAPSGGIGAVNDWYLDSVTGDYYEKTGATTWTLRGNLKGPAGATGPAGPTGATGATGPAGPTGPGGGASYTQLIGNGSAQTFTVTHNFGIREVQVAVYRTASPYDEIVVEVERTDVNTVTVRTTAVPATNEYTVIISGPGAAGGSADKNYVHTQSTLASTWTVSHGLGKYVAVEVVDSGNSVLYADVVYIDTNTVQINFAAATSGKVYVN